MMRGAYPSYAKRVMKEDGVTLNVSDEDKQTLLEGKADFFCLFILLFILCYNT